ncbi:MAG: VCBS repeat-containing protein, partial [Gammaproteobacteria bacterium]|nr:VCBS repeat-containing protein [Gammaproteobacteria bacterium]
VVTPVTRPVAAAVGDLDGDGLADIAVLTGRDDDGFDLRVGWGRPDGSFDLELLRESLNRTARPAIGDFRRSGGASLVIPREGNLLEVYEYSPGQGLVATSETLAFAGTAPAQLRRVDSVDLDDDGIADLVMLADQGIWMARGRAEGGYAPAVLVALPTDEFGRDVRLLYVDYDGDGRTDILFQDDRAYGAAVSVVGLLLRAAD